MPIEPTPQPTESVKPPTDPTCNLEAKDIRNPIPSIVPTNSILCGDRPSENTASTQDPYQGVPTCGATSASGKAIETQAKTDR
jgi:hypothetical protein